VCRVQLSVISNFLFYVARQGEEDEIQHPPAHKDGGKLLKGEFNESEEHEKFREAVLNWRKNGGKGAGSPSRRSSCWQCFKVLSSASTNLQFDGKNICSEACLSQAQKAKALRTERKAEVTSPIRKGADTAAAKQIFEASPSREQAKQEVCGASSPCVVKCLCSQNVPSNNSHALDCHTRSAVHRRRFKQPARYGGLEGVC